MVSFSFFHGHTHTDTHTHIHWHSRTVNTKSIQWIFSRAVPTVCIKTHCGLVVTERGWAETSSSCVTVFSGVIAKKSRGRNTILENWAGVNCRVQTMGTLSIENCSVFERFMESYFSQIRHKKRQSKGNVTHIQFQHDCDKNGTYKLLNIQICLQKMCHHWPTL